MIRQSKEGEYTGQIRWLHQFLMTHSRIMEPYHPSLAVSARQLLWPRRAHCSPDGSRSSAPDRNKTSELNYK